MWGGCGGRELVRQDPDNRAVQSDFKKAKLMANKMNEVPSCSAFPPLFLSFVLQVSCLSMRVYDGCAMPFATWFSSFLFFCDAFAAFVTRFGTGSGGAERAPLLSEPRTLRRGTSPLSS